ncbi:MAG: XdhC family protein [Acidimicrobiia bacterium]
MSDPILDAITQLTDRDQRGVVVTVIAGNGQGSNAVLDGTGSVIAGTIPPALADSVSADAVALMAREQTVTLGYGDTEVFFEMLSPRPRLFVFGAVHIAQELIQHAGLLGFHTIVADPRPAFVTKERFPDADELRVGWPGEVCDPSSFDERTFVVILTHDRRFEDPLWPIVLPSPARYLGAMGSAKTTAARRRRLLEAGFTPEQVDRIHGPIGLDIGSRTAGETAIAILAEMITERYLHDEPVALTGRPSRP